MTCVLFFSLGEKKISSFHKLYKFLLISQTTCILEIFWLVEYSFCHANEQIEVDCGRTCILF